MKQRKNEPILTPKKITLFTVLALLPAAWLGCSGDSPPVSESPVDLDSGSDSAGDSASKSDGATSSDGAAPTDGATSDDGTTHDSSAPFDASVDSAVNGPPPGAPTCDGGTWGTGTLLPLSTAGDDRLDSVTPDELSIAWTAGSAATAVVYYADRATIADAFGTPQALAVGQFTADRVAFSPDGLRLIVVNADARGFSELTRAARTGAGSSFGAAGTGPFDNIDSDTPAGASVGDPIVDSNDTAFYYSVYDGTLTMTIYRSSRLGLMPGESWGFGGAVDVAAGLKAVGSQRRRPTGISSDDRTIFYFDETTSKEGAAWINETSGQYDSLMDLGTRAWATASAGCGTLYYSSAGTSSLDLFTAP